MKFSKAVLQNQVNSGDFCSKDLKKENLFNKVSRCPFFDEKICENRSFCSMEEPLRTYLSAVDVGEIQTKIDRFFLNLQGEYVHGKEELLREWGYTDSEFEDFKFEFIKQGIKNYLYGNYTCVSLGQKGDIISIKIKMPTKEKGEYISFTTGWVVPKNGTILLAVPFMGM